MFPAAHPTNSSLLTRLLPGYRHRHKKQDITIIRYCVDREKAAKQLIEVAGVEDVLWLEEVVKELLHLRSYHRHDAANSFRTAHRACDITDVVPSAGERDEIVVVLNAVRLDEIQEAVTRYRELEQRLDSMQARLASMQARLTAGQAQNQELQRQLQSASHRARVRPRTSDSEDSADVSGSDSQDDEATPRPRRKSKKRTRVHAVEPGRPDDLIQDAFKGLLRVKMGISKSAGWPKYPDVAVEDPEWPRHPAATNPVDPTSDDDPGAGGDEAATGDGTPCCRLDFRYVRAACKRTLEEIRRQARLLHTKTAAELEEMTKNKKTVDRRRVRQKARTNSRKNAALQNPLRFGDAERAMLTRAGVEWDETDYEYEKRGTFPPTFVQGGYRPSPDRLHINETSPFKPARGGVADSEEQWGTPIVDLDVL